MSENTAKHIVIIGLGDTGLLAAVRLSKQFRVTAISTKPCMLSGQELGMRLSQPETWRKEYMQPFSSYSGLKHVSVIQGQVMAIHAEDNAITVCPYEGDEHMIQYDALLIASGVSNGFWRSPILQTQRQIEQQLQQHHDAINRAETLAIVGGGATGVSSAVNVARQYKDKSVHLFFSQDQVLPGYHQKTRAKLTQELLQSRVHLHANYRAVLHEEHNTQAICAGTINNLQGTAPLQADAVLWAIGQSQPNNQFIPAAMLNTNGFVNTDLQFNVVGYDNVFCVGDIADTDAQRCSARNGGYSIVAHNIACYLHGHGKKYRRFKPVTYRWGSILGVQKNGLTIYTASGGAFRIPQLIVRWVLFPLIVRNIIYKGVSH